MIDTKKKYDRQNKRIKTNRVAIYFRLDPNTCSDVINYIRQQENKTKFLVDLVRKEIKNNGK